MQKIGLKKGYSLIFTSCNPLVTGYISILNVTHNCNLNKLNNYKAIKPKGYRLQLKRGFRDSK